MSEWWLHYCRDCSHAWIGKDPSACCPGCESSNVNVRRGTP